MPESDRVTLVEFSDVNKILIIKLRHHGDVLLTTPVFYNLHKHFPNAQIDAYVYKDTWPMLAGLPFIHEGILYDKNWKKQGKLHRFIQEAKLLRKIRRNHYDMVINLTEGDRGAIAARISKAQYRIGVDPKGSGFKGKAGWFTHLIPDVNGIRHTVETNLDALRILGIFPSVNDRYLQFYIPQEDQKWVEQLLQNHGIGEYFLAHPVSRWMFKCWPAEKVAACIDQIYTDTHIPFLLTAAPVEEEMAFNKRVLSFIKQAKIIDLSGQLNLKQLGALIKGAKALLTVDSVPMHMSAAFKTPVIALFGPTSDKRWAPWQHSQAKLVFQNFACRPCYQPGCAKTHRSDCLETLEVDQVMQAYHSLKLFPK